MLADCSILPVSCGIVGLAVTLWIPVCLIGLGIFVWRTNRHG